MKRIVIVVIIFIMCLSHMLSGQVINSLPKEKMEALKSQDPVIKYNAVRSLNIESSLPDEVVDLLINYLSDLRGEIPGNTIAGKSAEILSNHPQYSKRAIPELLKLLAYTDKYGMPSGSAAKALRVVNRVDLEAYFAKLDKDKKLELSKSLTPVLKNGIGSLTGLATIVMIMGMLGEDITIPVLEKTLDDAKIQETNNRFAKDIVVRADASLKILKGKWEIGSANYIEVMKNSDSILGKPNQYISPIEVFGQALNLLNIKMEKSGAKIAYLIRADKIPFDVISNGVPMVRLANREGWNYLYTRFKLELSIQCMVRMVVLTSVSEHAYKEDYVPNGSRQPSYFPSTDDYAFIEMGANGPSLFDKALKSLLIEEGFNQNTWYEFWPVEWWIGTEKYLKNKQIMGDKVLWVKVMNGEIVSYNSE